jgi:hypothetical protein
MEPQHAVGNSSPQCPTITTEQQVATVAAQLRQQHQLAMLLGGSGMPLHSLHPYGDGMFPSINPTTVDASSPLDPALHALLLTRGMDSIGGAGTRIPSLDVSGSDSSVVMAQIQGQLLAFNAASDEEERRRQIQGKSSNNTSSPTKPVADGTNTQTADDADLIKNSE